MPRAGSETRRPAFVSGSPGEAVVHVDALTFRSLPGETRRPAFVSGSPVIRGGSFVGSPRAFLLMMVSGLLLNFPLIKSNLKVGAFS